MPSEIKNISLCEHNQTVKTLSNSLISYCILCGSFEFISETGNKIFSIKPKKSKFFSQIDPTIILASKDTPIQKFRNKKEYLKFRQQMIKETKKICLKNHLTLKTFFLAIYYFDNICSKLSIFSLDTLNSMSFFCLIIAAKFSENGSTAKLLENKYKGKISSNYQSDEIYILKLLDYNLNVITSYDIISSVINSGFVFDDEIFNNKKYLLIYSQIEKMIYAFVESKNFIEMTPKQIAFSIISFSRECLGLEVFSQRIKKIFNISYNDDLCFYLLRKIKLCFKIKSNESKDKLLSCEKEKQ